MLVGVKQQRVVASLDIGSNKIVCLVGYINVMGEICIKGLGHQQSRGIQQGRIVDKKEAEKSILSAITLAERMAGFNIQNITVNVSGSETSSSLINGNLKLNGKEVKDKNIEAIYKDIKEIIKKQNKEVVHLVPLQYTIDGNLVENAYGMDANEFGVTFNLVSTDKKNITVLKDCLKAMMLDMDNYISNAFAVSIGSLENTERELGVLSIDIGAGYTNFSVSYDDKYVFEGNIAIGGDNITRDISTILKISQATAEVVKVMNTDFSLSSLDEENLIRLEVNNDEDFEIAQNNIKLINEIVKARIEEIIDLIFISLKENELSSLIRYIVLSGGTSLIPGIETFINKLTHLETRVAFNSEINSQDRRIAEELKNPIYNVGLGILKYMQIKYNCKDNSCKNRSFFLDVLNKIFS